MKTIVADKKGKKRTHNENVKSNQAQGDINELKKNIKKAKFVDVKQNGSPVLEQKAPIVHKKKEQNKTIKQQSSPIKQSTTKGEIRAKTELTAAKPENETKGTRKKSRRSRPYSQVDLTAEQLTKKIAEIRSREELSKTARKKLAVLIRKLKEYGVASEKLDALQKKSNKKAENRANVLMKKANEEKQKANDEKKMKLEKKLVQSKGKPQEVDDDDSEEEEIDSDIEEESEEESDETEKQNVQLTVKTKEVEDESDEDEDEEDDEEEDEDEEDENESEIEEGEEELEIEEDEELESDEDEEEVESLEDEEDEEDDENDEEDEDEDETEKNTILKKIVLSGTKKKEMQNKQEQNKNKQEQNKNKQVQNKNTQEQNKNKQVPQSFDNQQKGELHKKRYVLFVGNLPLDITEDEIKQHFLTKVNTITSIRIPTKPDKTSRGFAYVEMTNNIDFEKGLSLNHTFLKKRRINVEYSRPSGGKNQDANKKFIVAKNMKLQALQKAGKLADGNQKKKFKKEK